MSEYDISLKRARSRQKLYYLIGAGGLGAAAALVVAVLLFFSGTNIEVLPEEAAQNADISVESGLAFAISGKLYSLSSEPSVNVSSPGFQVEVRKILPGESGGTVVVKLRELPGKVTASAEPSSDRTRWTIDGEVVAISEKLDVELQPGEHILEVNNPYYLMESKSFKIERGEEKDFGFNLQNFEGSLFVSSRPEGADIYIDGNKVGVTPTTVGRNGGTYRIELKKKNYITASDDIEVTNENSSVSRNYQLELKKSYIQFELQPPGGTLLVNGIKEENHSNVILPSLTDHTFKYLKDGYYSETKTAQLSPDETKKISFDLKIERGQVSIKSTPSANIYINGKKSGKTPADISLPAVTHSIELRRPGYRGVKKSILPSSVNPISINEKLKTELEARILEAPKEYKNSIGMRFKLFIPSDVLMGAPRHERGQRANEFQRAVRLTRPFYAAIYETTNEQYSKFTKKYGATRNEPATGMGWTEAALFANWLSSREKLKPFYLIKKNGTLRGFNSRSEGYRLLTEAEWEWLARRASKPKQTTFIWGEKDQVPPMAGNIADEYAKGKAPFYVPNYSDGHEGIAPVGSFGPEPSGLHDMFGNVSEWVHDYYSLIPPVLGQIEKDPLGGQDGDVHIFKGANWKSGTLTELRASYREGAENGRNDIGLRIGRYLYGGEKP